MWAQEQKPNQSTGGVYATDLSWSPVHIQNVESTADSGREFAITGPNPGKSTCALKI